MRAFYDNRQTVGGMFSFSPSARKPALALESWKGLGIHFTEQSFTPLEIAGGVPDAKSPNNAERWLKRLPGIVREFADVDLIMYNAGVDSHNNDPLGGNLTAEQMARRDRIVFEAAHEMAIPVCTSLAGGYQIAPDGSLNPVLSLHNTTFISAWEIFEAPEKKEHYEKWNLW